MALVSPGLEITVIDESQYIPGAVGTVPLLVIATEENKATPGGGTAAGTIKENAGRLYGVTSQRELVNLFGTPKFQLSAAGTPLHADERNEYGLLTAYSALGIANRAFVLRADVDLAELTSTTVRPKGDVDNGTYWLDLSATKWGVFEWNAETSEFVEKKILLVTDPAQMFFSLSIQTWSPTQTVGKIGDYAIIPRDPNNYLWHKNNNNFWTRVGQPAWEQNHPTATGFIIDPVVNLGDQIEINGVTVTFTLGTSVNDVANDINAASIPGVSATVTDDLRLQFRVDGNAASDGVNPDGNMNLVDITLGITNLLGFEQRVYYGPGVYNSPFNDVPDWASYGSTPRPTGSIWVKTTPQGGGADLAIKKYNSETDSWERLSSILSPNVASVVYELDPLGGGINIQAGTLFIRAGTNNSIVKYHPFIRVQQGATFATGTCIGAADDGLFDVGDQIEFGVSAPGTDVLTYYTVTLSGSRLLDVIADIQSAMIPNLTVSLSGNKTTLLHETGGVIYFRDLPSNSGQVFTTMGFGPTTPGVHQVNQYLHIDGFDPLDYIYSEDEPYTKPEDGTLWYYGTPTEIDIMYRDTNGWKGYKNVTVDARGYNLANTDPLGPIISPTQPRTQSDNTALVPGDLWVDSSDLVNYPKIYRYNTQNRWVLIDNSDRTTQNGIVFADARWDTDGTTDVVAGDLPSIVDMQFSNYIDLDAPDYRLYPRGALLFNTRRSSYNVKQFVSDYFNEDAYPDAPALPQVRDTWLTASGLKDNGAPYMGAGAQRAMVVKAMRAALDGSVQVREETNNFNLILAPGYPELISNMVALNTDRAETGFVIGDTPMTLKADVMSLTEWSENTNLDGLSTASPYLGVYYPSGLTNDLDGNVVAVPPSHMMLRTYIFNDNVSYPWFAPAGTRRGLVDNATAIGYVDVKSGAFVRTNINQGLRDALYETRLNPITSLPGIGLTVFGQKTRGITGTSMDRVNVARLVNYIRTILRVVGNQFLFEPNDKITRDQIKAIIDSAMNDLVSKRGIYDYAVVCDESNNTPVRIARNELYVDIAIEPMKAVEFIYIPIRLKNPGAISGGV